MSEPEKALRGPSAHLTAPPTTCGGPSPLGPISTPTWIRFAILTSVQLLCLKHLKTNAGAIWSRTAHQGSACSCLGGGVSHSLPPPPLGRPHCGGSQSGTIVGDWESWLKPEMESHCQAAPYVESNRRPTDQQSSAPRPPSVHRQEERREILEGLHRGDWSAWSSAETARSPTDCLCVLLVPVPAWIPGSKNNSRVQKQRHRSEAPRTPSDSV